LITYYNKDLFDKFGAQYPKAGYTWDDLYEMSKKLSRNEGGTAYSGYTPNFQYMLDMNPYSIPSVDVKTTKPTINTDPRWQQFFRTLVIPPSQSDVGIKERKPAASQPWKDLIGGTQALFVYSSSPLAAATSYWPGHRIDVTTAPVFKDNSKLQGSMPFGQYVGITKMAKNKDAAMEVIKYLLSDEVQTVQARSGNIPVVTTRAVWDELGKETADWSRSLNWEALRKATMAPIPVTGVFERSVNTVYAKYASQVMFGELDMNTAFRLAEEEAQKAIDSLKEGYVQGIAY
ncbi:MAG: extracellular solute-binding protein family 1, partial [Paenibacillus sp.]|nr:extracellular solute-binding protein family 1 [Paenibacillus sp.]